MKNRFMTVLLVFCIILGVGLLIYPGFSERWNKKHQTRAIAQYTAAVEQENTEALKEMMDRARKYNLAIGEQGIDLLPESRDTALYESELSLPGMRTMCYLDIPRVNVYLPVYHGTSESTMQTAAGHLEGTSLPVGGESTHCVLTGHRGLPTARLFTDLDQLNIGDIFTIRTLGEELDYQVDQIRVIEPFDLSAIQIEEGRDLVTLLTCTPYGINTQRLAIRGSRIERKMAASGKTVSGIARVTSDATQIDPIGATPVIAIPLLFLVLCLRRKNAGLMPVRYKELKI